jgi:hypothetical protein
MQFLKFMSEQDSPQQFIFAIGVLHGLVINDMVASSIEASGNLLLLFDELLQGTDLETDYQIRASFTEVHRLLKILQRELAFWRSAKQSSVIRRAQVLATLGKIQEFSQLWH